MTNSVPYSPVRRSPVSSQLLFVSGQLPVVAGSDAILGSDIVAQLQLALQNTVNVLAGVGASKADILKVTIYVTDLEAYTALNAAYIEFMDGNLPARSVVQVAKLPRNASVEVEAIAAIRGTNG